MHPILEKYLSAFNWAWGMEEDLIVNYTEFGWFNRTKAEQEVRKEAEKLLPLDDEDEEEP
ncbi:MAG TPA: hypothetical protein VIJ14_00110 [Rhabdochlamydiaceae bacterium]